MGKAMKTLKRDLQMARGRWRGIQLGLDDKKDRPLKGVRGRKALTVLSWGM